MWFYYKLCFCLTMLVLHGKILVTFDKDLLFTKSHVFYLKKWKLPGALAELGFTIYPWNFAHLLYAATPKRSCVDFFVFLRYTNWEKIWFNEYLAGNCQEKACAKFQRKTINFTELEPLEILIVSDKRPSSW